MDAGRELTLESSRTQAKECGVNVPTIERVEAIPFRIPFSTFLRSGLQMHVRQAENVLIRVTTSDGKTGIAEANAFAELFGESQASIVDAVNNWIAPRIRGVAVCDIALIASRLDVIANNNSAKAAVDIAVHDAFSRSIGIPLHRLLGGHSDQVALTWIIGQGSVEEMLDEAVEARERGFTSFKIKIGLDPEKDVAVIGRLRTQLGDDVTLYVDANQAYRYAQALWALPRMEAQGIAIVEDPIANTDIQGRRNLAERLSVPLLGDECVRTPAEMGREVELGILRMINIKTPRSGYSATRRIIHIAECAGVAWLTGTMLETDIGVLAAAQFAAALGTKYPAELTYWLKMDGRLLDQDLQVTNGILHLPSNPGLGADIDPEKFERYRVTL